MRDGSDKLFWRRLDVPGLERLALSLSAEAVLAESVVICLEDGGFRLDHRWRRRRICAPFRSRWSDGVQTSGRAST